MPDIRVSVFFGFHDSCVTFADRSDILLHLEAERVLRRKHAAVDAAGMDALIAVGLQYLGRGIDDVERLYVGRLEAKYPRFPVILGRKLEAIAVGHHHSHIGAVIGQLSEDAVVLCADGGSEDGTTRIYHYRADRAALDMVEDLDGTLMTGRFYGSLTQLVIEPEFMRAHAFSPGKTMGLAAFGCSTPDAAARLTPWLDRLSQCQFDITQLRDAVGLSADYREPWNDQLRKDLAHTGQQLWIDAFRQKLSEHRSFAGTLALVGGCALNVVLTSLLADTGMFERVIVGPVCGDCGQSLGALLFCERDLNCRWPFLGRGFGELHEIPDRLVGDLLDQKLVAWYQGRSEVGPRGLGHRSILGIPSTLAMRDRLNQVKGREPYRPVAPVLVEEALSEFFQSNQASPYMNFAPRAREATCRLAPAIVHVDGTSRIQTLRRTDNPVLHEVLHTIGRHTGAPILMNSSFNVAGEPIVDSPDDALRSFHASGADVLYLNGQRIERKTHPRHA